MRALDRQVSEIARAIEGGDTKALQQLPGIGARTAQTIIAHLQGRLLEEATLPDASGRKPPTGEPDMRDDAIEALLALQYGRREAESMVAAALEAHPDIADLETLLRAVLEQRVR